MVQSCRLSCVSSVFGGIFWPVICVYAAPGGEVHSTHITGQNMLPNTDHAHDNLHDWTIVILVKYSLSLPDDGSCVIQNMLE
jgi:hypothetical protein